MGSLTGNFFWIIIFLLSSTSLKLVKDSVRQEIRYQQLLAKQVQTELNMLKSQINPHFLFNTLNNIFGIAKRHKDQTTADAISRLANILRYVIYETKTERIILKKEIEQINDYLELMKLRYTDEDDIHINFSWDGPVDSAVIAPMILMPFIENAFKHSVSMKTATNIDINLNCSVTEIEFSLNNTINRSETEVDDNSQGIGLDNIQRRLNLIYSGSHDLTIADDGNTFNVNLKIYNM